MAIRLKLEQSDLDAFTNNRVTMYGHMNVDREVPEGDYLINSVGHVRHAYEGEAWGSPTTLYAYYDYVILVADDGYKIDLATVKDKVGEDMIGNPMYDTYTLELFDGGLKAKLVTNLNDIQEWNINTSENIVIVDFYTFNQNDLNNISNVGAVGKINDVSLSVGDIFRGGDILTIEINPDNSKSFNINDGVTSVNFKYVNSSDELEIINFILTDNNKIAKLSLTLPENYSETNSFNFGTITYDVSGANHIYVTNKSKLESINSERFTVPTSVGGEIKDWGEFILSVTRYPFKIPNDYLNDESSVILANRVLDTKAPVIINENLVINVGDIHVSGENNNLLDYVNAKCILHLPFIKPVELDINYVMDYKITIEYKVNLNSGAVLVLVSSDKYGEVFAQFNDKIGYEIPYIGNAWVNSNDIFKINSSVYNDNRQCYLEVINFENPLKDGFFNSPVKDMGTLNGNVGYIEVNNIDLKVNCYSDERNMLTNILKSGVIIL